MANDVEAASITASLKLVVDEFNRSLNKTENDLKQTGQSAKKSGEQLDDVGSAAKTSSKDFLDLDDAVNKLKGSFTLLAIGGALAAGVKATLELQQAAIQTQNAFQIMTSSIEEASAALNTYYEASSRIYGDSSSSTSAAEAVRRSWYRDADGLDEEGFRLVQAFTDVASAYGMDAGELVYTQQKIMEKWGIPDDEALARLAQINELSQSMKDDPRKNFQTTISTLRDYDDVLQEMNYTFEESLALLKAWDDAGVDTATSLDQLVRIYNGFGTQMGLSSEKVATLTEEIAALAAEGKDTTEKEAELAEWRSLIDANQGELARQLFDDLAKGGTASEQLARVSDFSGTGKRELFKASAASNNISQYDYAVTDDMINKITVRDRDFLSEMGLVFQNFVGNISQGLTPNSPLSSQYAEYREIEEILRQQSPEAASELWRRYATPWHLSTPASREEALREARDQIQINLTIDGMNANQKTEYTVQMEQESADVWSGIAQR